MENFNIFEMLYETYKTNTNNPLRVIEFFGGYGSQTLALKYLGVKYEHWKLCEWAIPSIIAYASVHRNELEWYGQNFCGDLTKEQIVNQLFQYGVSSDYSKPATLDQLKRMPEDKLRLCFNSIQWANNLVDISRVSGKELNIKETDKFTYLLTYSFPCITSDSLILTKRGYIQMKDVTTDDIVLTKSNTWQKVAKKFDNGIHQTCYLDGMGFENIHCTLNHKFYVREMYREWDNFKRTYVRKFKKPDFKETKDLTKKDYFGVPVIQEEKKFYTDDLDFWYMIGMYLGDGWLSKSCNDVIIACNEKKLELLKQKLNQEKWKYTYSWNGTCYRFRFSNKEIYNFIKDNIGTGCEEKHIPYEILCLPKKQLNELYNGYLDSDGSKVNNIRQFTSINRNLIYSMSLIINKLFNIPTKIYKVKVKSQKQIEDRIVNQKDWYQLRFKTTIDKQDKAFYENGYIWYPFNKITMAKKEHVYNMEIENDHSYIIQGCISKNCQDLSLAGKCAGMEKGSGTRSGLLWEVERILGECEHKPQILVMENVTQVHGAGNEQHFKQWMLRLEEMGYQNYWHDLSATEFKIPQTRNRTFMVSILGDYNYTFPKKTKLELRLKDLLEPEGTVDEKYYISDKMINYISKTGANGFNNKDAKINLDIARPLTTDPNKRAGTTNYLSSDFPGNFDLNELNKPSFEEVYDKIKNSSFNTNQRRIQEREVCDTLCARDWKDPKLVIESLKIKNATKKGYLEATEGDGIDISSRMDFHRGTVQKGKSQTITTMGGEDVGVVVGTYDYAQSDTLRPNEEARLHIGKDVSGTIISSGNHNGVVIKENNSKENLGYTEKSLNKIKKNIVDENNVSGSLTATGMQSLNHDGCQLGSLKRGYSIEVKEEKCETNKVDYIGNYSKSNFNQTSIVGKNGIAPTVTENHGQVTSICESELLGGIGEKDSNGGTQWKFQNRVYNSENSSPSVTTAFNPNYKAGLRIRKLTPRECFRLQAVKDEDIDLIMENQSNSLGYHLAGDSICITVLMGIFSKLFDIEWLEHFKPEEWWKN